MVSASSLAFVAVLLPIFAAALANLVAKIPKAGNALAKGLCILTSYVTFSITLTLTHVVLEGGAVTGSIQLATLLDGAFTFTIYVDGLALVPTTLSALFASLAQTFSVKYLSPENRYRRVAPTFNLAYTSMLFFLGGMIGACFSSNIIMIVIFWEVTSLCSWALVNFWHEDPTCRAAALKTLIMTHIGTLALIVGAITIYHAVGTWEIHRWALAAQDTAARTAMYIAMLLIFIGTLPKSVQFPMHTWLPDATVAPTPATAYVHVVGFLMGLYAFPRFFGQVFVPYIQPLATPHQLTALFSNISPWNVMISLTGAVTLIIASISGLLESESKRLIAYCHISTLGITVMALGFGTPSGIAAGLFSMIPHVLFCALLFFAIGAAIYRTGRTSIYDMVGLSANMPITTALATIGVLSWVSFPFLAYFNALWLKIHATLEVGAPAFIALLFLGAALKTAAVLRMLHAIFFCKAQERYEEVKEAPALMLFPMLFLSTCLVIIGAFPQLLLNYIVLPAVNQLGLQAASRPALDDIVTALGFWNPAWALLAFLLYFSLIAAGIRLSSKGARVKRAYVKEGEVFKPFLCGEDIDLLNGARAYHFYHALTYVAKVDKLRRALDIDRLYNALANGFLNFCSRLLLLDVRQRYRAAALSFVAGSAIITLIAILAG